jgi:predicted dehydrogenase
MTPLGLGLIGCGGYGYFCLEAYNEMPALCIRAVADVDERRAQELAVYYGATVYRDAAALIADPAVQVVAVNTPPHLHAPQAISALRSGKHVFVEKPLALTTADGQAMLDIARQSGTQLAIDYVMRYNPLYFALRDIARRNVLGPLSRVTVENHASDEFLPPGHWFWNKAESGGIFVEHGVHFFDIVGWLVGSEPAQVSALALQRSETGQEDRVLATVRYGNDVTATFYHAFTRSRRMESTTVRAAFLQGDVALHGWVPTEMEIDAWVDENGLAALQAIPLTKAVHVVETYVGEGRRGVAGGRPYDVAAHVRATVTLPEGKQAVYRRSVQLAMGDLVAAIADPAHTPQVTAQDGLTSLALALSADRAAHREQ